MVAVPEAPLAVAGEREFLSRQLLTYLGNKRLLLPVLERAVLRVRERLGGRRLSSLDAFAGSGVVSRLLKLHSDLVVANDAEDYARAVAACYLRNRDEVDLPALLDAVHRLNRAADRPAEGPAGFVERLYAPLDDDDIQPGERAFYTRANARRLDGYARGIAALDEELRPLLLGPLLWSASVHANTSGVFKGFYKDKHTGRGKFGAASGEALPRILGRIELEPPVLSSAGGDWRVLQHDANDLPAHVPEVDLAYLDPPYNQHPYGSNYFMLNLLTDYREPAEISAVSGIPAGWRRSGYNSRARSVELFRDLVERLPARFLLVSFNDEGFIPPARMRELLATAGPVLEFRARHNTFRGSRNLTARRIHVTEHVFLVERR